MAKNIKENLSAPTRSEKPFEQRDSNKPIQTGGFGKKKELPNEIGKINSLRIQIEVGTLPKSTDIAFTPSDKLASAGTLNELTLETLGYSRKDLPRNKLKEGFTWVEAPPRAPIIFIVTIDKDVKYALENNLSRAIEQYREQLLGKDLWVPLMGTGEGGLNLEQSLESTILAFLRFPFTSKRITNLHLSLPPEIQENEAQMLQNIAKEVISSDAIPLHLDNPAQVDFLGHLPFVKALSRHIKRIWEENEYLLKSNKNHALQNQAFMIHIYGQWGSGKSTILNLLKNELQAANIDSPKNNERWVVIEFNAWQHQHLDPPWWPLMNTLYAQATRQLWNRDLFGKRWHAFKICVKEYIWRFFAGRTLVFLSLLLIVLVFVLVIWLDIFRIFELSGSNIGSNLTDKTTSFKIITGVVTIASAMWTLFLGVSRSLLPGSAKAAQSFLQFTSDPMKALSKHFDKLIRNMDASVAVFIDDLDRCKSNYVVRLLEGIQTLYRNNHILYVIAADKEWISTCFEESYENFTDTVRLPGQRLGYLFVEKSFQLSTRVPVLSVESQTKYLDYLLTLKENTEEGTPYPQPNNVAKIFSSESSEDDILTKLKDALNDKQLPSLLLREAAIERLSQRRVRALTEHSLRSFVNLLEPNPRAMKRLINFYSIFREITILEGSNLERSKLVRWLILSMRWPLLAEYLEDNPEHVAYILDSGSKKLKGKNLSFENLELDDELRKLFSAEEVKKVVQGGEVKDTLDAETVRICTGKEFVRIPDSS